MMSSTEQDLSVVLPAGEREVVISRFFAYPRELVFKAWSSPEHLAQWYGPSGFSTTTTEFDFRPGGLWRHTMHGPDGTDYPNRKVYKEITPPARLVYDNGWDVEGAEPLFEATVNFDAVDGGTLVTMRSVFQTAEARNEVVEKYGAIEGGKQTLARLNEYLGVLRSAQSG